MKPRTHVADRGRRSANNQGEGPNWMLIAGSALLSTLSIHVARKLKKALEAKQPDQGPLKGIENFADRRSSRVGLRNSNVYSVGSEEYGCFNCSAGGEEGMPDINHHQKGRALSEPDGTLPLVAVSAPGYHRENGNIWASSSPERLELPPKPFHPSNCSDSASVSECGSDIYAKREVIQKLRQQLKRRDDMILEMQDQLVELQNSLSAQRSHSNQLQVQLDCTSRKLFESEREIQKLRKALADHCVEHTEANNKHSPASSEGQNGQFPDSESDFTIPERGRSERDRIEMLRGEIQELKEVIQGKEFLVQSYKEQKTELSMKVKELQQRLDSQLPNIL